MNISKKLTIWIVSIVLIIGIMATYLYYKIEIKEEDERLKSFGSTVGQILEQSLASYMLIKDFSAIDKTLQDISNIQPINRIWLINREGVIIASTVKEETGTTLSYDAPECIKCHKNKEGKLSIKMDTVFRWVQPIKNKPECYKCHSPHIKNNGIFIIDFSLYKTEKLLKRNILTGLSIFIAALIVISIVILFLSKKFIIKRLYNIIEKLNMFKEGNYEARITGEGNDEITNLTDSFNKMAEAINARDIEKNILFKQISSSYERWQNTFDSITDLISIHDNDFNIIMANKAFLEYFGLSLEEVKSKKCYEIFHETNLPTNGCPHITTLTENRNETGEILDPKNNRIFQVSTFPFSYPEAEFHGSIHIAKDITEEKEKEMRLIMSERLAALGQMASGIAHEINNPLASIAGCTEGLLSRIKKKQFEPELFENYLKIIEEEILRCKTITTGMLSFVRKTTYEKKEVNLNETLDRTLEIIGFQGRLQEVEVIKNYKKEMPVIYGSEGELRQVFLAIIMNAIDAMEDRGTLTIETGVIPHPPDKSPHPLLEKIPPPPPFTKGGQGGITEKEGEGGFVFIKITDTGPGIPPEDIGKIFAPFFTTKSEKGGTGLGLSIARKIITNHSGNIDVISEVRQGTTFKITLPI
jgi:PAS domain S-box-containing protein